MFERVPAGVVVALCVTLFGVGTLAGLAYADRTATTRADYERYRADCDALDEESRLVDGGLGMEREPLDEADVRRCRNTSYEAYRAARHRSLTSAPIGTAQWLAYGSVGLGTTVGGLALLRRERAAAR